MQLSDELILFGDRSDFAIEAGEDGRTSQIWGHMCVWCNGMMLGDVTEPHCGLAGPANEFRLLIEAGLDRLWDSAFVGMSDREVWNFLDGRLFGHHGDVMLRQDEWADGEAYDYWKFSFLTNWEEMFDGYKGFLLCPPGRPVRILSREFPPHAGLGVDVSRAGFLHAAAGFVRWFDGRNEHVTTSHA